MGEHVHLTIQHPDGSYEHVRDLDREKQWEAENNRTNARRYELRNALKTRMLTADEMSEVLALGTELMATAHTGFGQPYYPREREQDYLFLLNTQAAIRKLAGVNPPNVPDQPRGNPAPQAKVTPARVGL